MLSKKRVHDKRRSIAYRRHKPFTIMALVIGLPVIFATLVHLASSTPDPVQTQPPPLAKEYMYAGSRLIATETCYSIAPSCKSFGNQGDEASFTITAAANCSWNAVSNNSWLEITSATSGTGNGVINYLVRDNFTTAGRQGTITVAGITFTVFQRGVGNCAFSISPVFATHGQGGGAGAVTVNTTPECSWNAVSNDSWITIISGCGLGTGTAVYGLSVNDTGSTRSGTITIQGNTFAIKQTAD